MFIHPTSIVKTKEIGKGTYIGPFCYISERVVIGKNCNIVRHTSIGAPAQFKVPPKDNGNSIIIGDDVEIREFVTINTPVESITEIGNHTYIMANSHIGHDSILEHDVVIGVGAAMSGYSFVGKYCYIGLNATTHQHAELGAYSIVGANSFFKGRSPMGITWAGVPARPIKVNLHNINLNAPLDIRQTIINEATRFIKEFNK